MPMTTRPAMRTSVVGSDGGDHRAGAEHRHAGQHDLLAPEEVADGAEAQHEAGEGQGVAVHHPLQLAHRGMQFALHIGQHHRDDRVVEEGQEEDEEEGRQGQPIEIETLRKLRASPAEIWVTLPNPAEAT